jgi:hypothetical protein
MRAALHGESAPTVAGRVVGEQHVGAMVTFLTNDLTAIRLRHRL